MARGSLCFSRSFSCLCSVSLFSPRRHVFCSGYLLVCQALSSTSLPRLSLFFVVVLLLRQLLISSPDRYMRPGALSDNKCIRKGETLTLRTYLLSTALTSNRTPAAFSERFASFCCLLLSSCPSCVTVYRVMLTHVPPQHSL
jgi:hypothetical protein